ncbi:hypothetical protein C8F01DRAFT_1294233 [Mycena amicta]|nr:hypothetical protein C8F01DRAFT_1294233 [Mycena amicta]
METSGVEWEMRNGGSEQQAGEEERRGQHGHERLVVQPPRARQHVGVAAGFASRLARLAVIVVVGVARWLHALLEAMEEMAFITLLIKQPENLFPAQPTREPPPVIGTVHSRPDPTVSSDSDTPLTGLGSTKSPQTRRVVQKRRIEDRPVLEPLVYNTPPHAQHTPASELVPVLTPGPDTRPAPPTWSEEQALLLTALKLMLTRAVATTGALQLEGDPAATYPPAVHALVRTLCERVGTTPLPQTTTPTFASVAATAIAKPCPDHASATQPPAAKHPCAGTKQAPTPLTPASASRLPQPPRARTRRPSQRHSPQRLIVRWLQGPPDIRMHSAFDILDALTIQLHGTPAYNKLVAASWTTTGNLALYVQAPYTAAQLLPHADQIGKALEMLWKGVGDAEYSAGRGDLWQQIESQGYNVDGLATATPMVKGELDASQQYVSLKVSFKDPAAAQRILAQCGVILYSAHCRVSRYRG